MYYFFLHFKLFLCKNVLMSLCNGTVFQARPGHHVTSPRVLRNHCVEIMTVLSDVTSFELRKTSVKSVLISTSKPMRETSSPVLQRFFR